MSETDFRSRTEILIGEEGIARLAKAHVLVLGLGGVGGMAAEMLVRAGVGKLTLIDGDTVEISNLNRQAVAWRSTVGMLKTEAMAVRLRDINPEVELVTVPRYLAAEDAAQVLDPAPDFAVDAIDDVPAKVAFLLAAYERHIPLISAMGAGGRMDPERVRFCDLSGTCQCGLARAVRTRLREHGVTKGIPVVFSPEVPVHTAPGPVGTISCMPNIFGAFCAAAVLRHLAGKQVDLN